MIAFTILAAVLVVVVAALGKALPVANVVSYHSPQTSGRAVSLLIESIRIPVEVEAVSHIIVTLRSETLPVTLSVS